MTQEHATPSTDPQYRLSIRRPVTMAMLFLTLIVFGWKSYQELPVNLMPDISYPTLTVRTEYESAAPEDVEELVTRVLEEQLAVVSGVVQISSVSSAGLSEIILEFTWDTDMKVAMQDVREALDAFNPPQGVTRKPIILRFDPTLDPVMRVAIAGSDLSGFTDPVERDRRLRSDLTEIREAAERYVKGDLEAEVGIAQVVVRGGVEEEIQILVDGERLKTLGLSLQTVVTSLEQQNINLSGGSLKEGKTEYLVRTLNEFQNVEEIQGVIVRVPTGETLRLGDIADILVGEEERETIVRANGQEAVELEIFKEGDANTVDVCDKLKEFFGFEQEPGMIETARLRAAENSPTEANQAWLKEYKRKQLLADKLRSRLPRYASPIMITDQSRFIVAAIREVQSTAITGGILALIVLYLFLRELRSTIIIGVSIPISIVATFVPMYMRDVSLNIMSLGGLALGVGMLVDNSIVVLESIYRCREEGDEPVVGAERGTREVASAVAASTFTTIAVFLPIVFVEGIAGQLFRDLALTVTFSLIASLLVALYLIPMIASRPPLVLSQQRRAVWVLRAYFDARSDKGLSAGRAVGAVPALGVTYAKEWMAQTWNDTVAPIWRGVRDPETLTPRRFAPRGLERLGCVLLLPVLIVLFVVQGLLRLIAAILTTALFIVAVVVAGALLAVAKIGGLILRLPVNAFNHAFNAVRSLYSALLRQALRFSPLVLGAILLLAFDAGHRALSLGQELIPPLSQGEFGIRIEAPPGTRLEDTELRALAVEQVVRDFAEVEQVTLQVGSEQASASAEEGENVAELTVKLKNPEVNAQFQASIIEDIREAVLRVTSDQVTFTLPTLFSFKTAIEIQIYGDDLDTLRELGQTVVANVGGVPGLKDPELSLKKGYPEIHIAMDRQLLSTNNVSPYQVAQMLRTEIQGDVASRFSRGGEKIDIRVRSDEQRLSSLSDLRNLSIVDGFPPKPLSSVASITTEEGPSEIRRIDQRQVVIVAANVEGRDLGSVAGELGVILSAMDWPGGYIYEIGGQQRELETSYNGLVFALVLATFLVYVVMACQFESVWHPLLIMCSVPLAFVGVVYALDFMDVSVSIVVFIGGIVLAGIVVNGAIVLVDYINQLRARGMKKVDAIVEAGTVRFRPIMMTTLTTVLGLIPMAMSTGEGAEMRGPLAVTVMAGLSSGTILTLFVMPIVYNYFGGRDHDEDVAPPPTEGA